MVKLYFILIGLIFSSVCFGQVENDTTFNEALKVHLRKYNNRSNIAYEQKDIKKGQILFDSLVTNHLKGTSFEDYAFKTVGNKKVKLSSYNKPVFILTYASWCVHSKGEIAALNKLAQKYVNDVKFVVLFWDKKRDIKKISKKFNHNISVCYAHESYKNDATIVANLKHSLGFPTSYFLDQELKVVNIKRGGAQPELKSSYVKAYTMNYNAFREGLGSLLIGKNISDEKLTTN